MQINKWNYYCLYLVLFLVRLLKFFNKLDGKILFFMIIFTNLPLFIFLGSGSGSGDGSDETMISSGDGGNEVVFETSAPTHPPPPTTTRAPDRTRTTASTASTMSLTRALAHYVLPIVLVCFGGAISDLL